MGDSHFLYLSQADVAKTDISMAETISQLIRMFRLKGEGRIEMPPKPGIHTQPDAFIHSMPAYIHDMNAAGMKWVSGYPDNYRKGLPYITGLLILNNPETGLPLAVMDCVWITAKRTGAATAVAAQLLPKPDCAPWAFSAAGGEQPGSAARRAEGDPQNYYAADVFCGSAGHFDGPTRLWPVGLQLKSERSC